MGLGFLIYLHELNVLFLLFPVLLNFAVVQLVAKTSFGPAVLWALNLAILLAIRWCDNLGMDIGELLGDSPAGWTATYPLVMLRMLSFGIDCCAAASQGGNPTTSVLVSFQTKHTDSNEEMLLNTNGGNIKFRWLGSIRHFFLCCPRCKRRRVGTGSHACQSQVSRLIFGYNCFEQREATHRTPEEYSNFGLFLAYLSYAPVYMSGPTMTFNSFASYIKVCSSLLALVASPQLY
jgi:hypothetical protein